MASAELKPWQAQGDDKRKAVRALFAQIAPTYDAANSIMSAWGHNRWRRQAIEAIRLMPGESLLDVCCGTGDFLVEARRKAGATNRLVGLDFCEPMLRIAEKKVRGDTTLTLADATHLPLTDAQFDAVTVGWGLRNVPDLTATLDEIIRVLKPGGRVVCLDMSQAQGFVGRIGNAGYHLLVPLLGKLLGQPDAYSYLPQSTDRFFTAQGLAEEFRKAGFQQVQFQSKFFGLIAMHWGVKP